MHKEKILCCIIKKQVCLFIIFIFITVLGFSQTTQSYYFKNLNIEGGLSQNTVNAILQDRNGFIWFGTKDGLNRYDGISIKVFKNTNGLENGFITCLFEDKDGRIWIGTDVNVYIYNPYDEHFEHFAQKAQNGQVINKTIYKIEAGENGNILISVDGLGLFSYNPDKNELYNYEFPDKGNVRDFKIDGTGRIWIALYNGLYFTDDNFNTLKQYNQKSGKDLQDEIITKIYLGNFNKIYLGTENNGMMELNLVTQTVRELPLSRNKSNPIFVRSLYPYSDKELWIGTETGIYIYDMETDACNHITNILSDPFSISDNAIYSLYKDREGGMWIGSYFGGVNYYPKQTTVFEKYYPTNDSKTLQGQRVREICKGKNNILWIGTEDAGLFQFDSSTKEFKHYTPSAQYSNIHGLCMDGDELWVGTFSKGVRVINTTTGHTKSYTANDIPATINDNYIFSIIKTSSGSIYLGTGIGLIKYDKLKGTFEQVSELDNNLVYDIKEDSSGNLWMATYVNGVFRYDPKSGKCEHFEYSSKEGSLPYNKVLSIFEDSKKQIWLTTEGRGFCRFDPLTKTFIQYSTQQGSPSDVVYQIVEDELGYFWITTNTGLVKFHPDTKEIKTYTVASGLLSDQFNYKSSYKASNGDIWLGCINGLISFNPQSFSENKYVPPVYITDFLLYNKPVVIGNGNSPLQKSIIFSDTIVLKHNQNYFSLRVAALSFQAPEVNSLQYKLEGLDEDWHSISESHLISYSNLDEGEYLLRIKGSNNDDVWNPQEKTLFIKILPPFYQTTWAYLIYILLFILALYLFIRYLIRRQKLHQKWFIQELEQNKEREIYDAKIRFFTNITHEIRTPLSLIKGPLENIITKNNIEEKDTRDDLFIMKKNTDRLLDLTNQLLDFKETEKEGFFLNFSEHNISKILTEIYQRFSPMIKQYKRTFILTISDEDFYAYIDKEAFIKIISNLFSNAIKYAERNINASLIVDNESETFEVRIENDGQIVSKEFFEEVFKPFTRLNHPDQADIPGAGIGMPLARSLAELHNGTLEMIENDNLNRFSLVLPTYQKSKISINDDVEKEDSSTFSHTIITGLVDKTYTILIVEDSSDMQKFVKKILPEKYNILTATNGEEALDILKNNFVTLIISDIMMPRMNGIELCKIIKSDVNYSHTPIVLLTAKTNLQSKIEGMEVGADAYVEKPFSPEYLQAVISNLITSREKLKEAFLKNPMAISSSTVTSETDKKFLNKLRNTIHQNIGNSDLKMEDIAETLNMSRASFYRKIKGVLDMSPNEYLRIERLRMAAQLIKENKYPIGEISYIVGFNSWSYFSKCFQEQFGVLPKDYK